MTSQLKKSALSLYGKLVQLPHGPENSKALKHMDAIIEERPVRVAIEGSTVCNSRCVFCAYPKQKRPKTILPLDLFKKICSDYADIGGGLLGFSPLMSDPLTDPLIMDRIDHINSTHETIKMHMFTNAIALNRINDEELTTILMSLEHIDVSIGGLNREDYKAMFAVDKFDAVWQSLFRLAEMKEKIDSACRLKLHIRTHRKQDVLKDPALQEIINIGFQCSDVLDNFGNWGGIVSQEDLPAGAKMNTDTDNTDKRTPCFPAMVYMSILPDGKVTGCNCMDGGTRALIGDISKQSMSEIWQSEKAKAFRLGFRRGKVPELCRGCSYYSAYDKILANRGLIDFDPSQDLYSKLL